MKGEQRVWSRYLGALLLTAISLALATWSIIEARRKEHDPPIPHQVLLTHQLNKLERPTPDTVFLGDSSLGNAISASHWQQLAGTSAVNLALTGTYGYAGSYNFLRRLLRRGRPNNVVLMHTADMLIRAASTRGFELTRPEPNWLERFSMYWQRTMTFSALWAAVHTHERRASTGHRAAPRELLRDDYILQGSPLPPSQQRAVLNARRIQPTALEFLHEIVALCKEQRLNCMYAYGPLAEQTCDASDAYLGAASQILLASGVRLIGERPLCLKPGEVGDAIDHVHPMSKRRVTERYYEMLRPFLK